MPIAYCGECDWQHRADENSPVELGRAMIDHFVETGHSPVEKCSSGEPPEIAPADNAVEGSQSGDAELVSGPEHSSPSSE